ncbi:hypothetical protein ACFSL4_33170 [Streptomyces caeni]|uniref:Uncharacterized protein n=1 Tax=Streptomyces caeni TaxID=2307231 RepID=A0ABW4J216_9ACTN
MRLPWRRTWVCPHCFRTVTGTQIAYVCVSGDPACADGRGLAHAAPRAGRAVCRAFEDPDLDQVLGRAVDRGVGDLRPVGPRLLRHAPLPPGIAASTELCVN